MLACAYISGPSSMDDLRASVVKSCGAPPNSGRVASTIGRLIGLGSIVDFDGLLRVSEDVHGMLQQQENARRTSEHRCQDRFKSMAQERGLEDRVAELWSVMEAEVVVAVVQRMGPDCTSYSRHLRQLQVVHMCPSIEHFTFALWRRYPIAVRRILRSARPGCARVCA